MDKLKHIVVIDDDDISNFLVKRSINKECLCKSIDCFSNGQEGYEYLRKLKAENKPLPELILLDINMPVMDGYTFLENLNTLCTKTLWQERIVVVSNSITVNDQKKLNSMGFHRTILKPVNTAKIIQLLN
ncbi:MAG: response regulator [Cytophagaceae bacterium]